MLRISVTTDLLGTLEFSAPNTWSPWTCNGQTLSDPMQVIADEIYSRAHSVMLTGELDEITGES